MDSRSTRPVRTGRALCVMELQEDSGTRAGWVKLLVSIPGRQGTMERVWDCPAGNMTPADYTDFEAFIQDALTQAVLASKGLALQLFRT